MIFLIPSFCLLRATLDIANLRTRKKLEKFFLHGSGFSYLADPMRNDTKERTITTSPIR